MFFDILHISLTSVSTHFWKASHAALSKNYFSSYVIMYYTQIFTYFFHGLFNDTLSNSDSVGNDRMVNE
jgi:hypothetical protein